MTDPSPLRKRPLEADAATSVRDNDEIDIAGCATIAYSSENPVHPVEHLLDRRSGPGTTRWISARPDTVEHIVVEFDQPRAIGRLVYEVEEAIRERTQEVRVEVSEDGGRTYRQILVQQYTFSPRGATSNARKSALISARLAISVSRLFQTRTAPERLHLRRSASLRNGLNGPPVAEGRVLSAERES
jgi:F5/8 type C domain